MAGKLDKQRASPDHSTTLEKNVQVIKRWERALLLMRSRTEQAGDWIAYAAGTGTVLLLHFLWFAGWVIVNVGGISGIQPFDPFPFPLLTTTVSLEVIFLTLFVLASQNRMAKQADKRSHFDLQINLLAEQEMTAVLRLLDDIARHLNIETSVTREQLADLMKQTDLRRVMSKTEELAELHLAERDD